MKEILVLIDTTEASEQRVEMAIHYAHHVGAHITSLLIKPEIKAPKYTDKAVFLEFHERYIAELNIRITEIEEQFEQSIANLTRGADWVVETGEVNETLVGYARRSDLLFLGQHSPVHQKEPVIEEPDQIILRSGRPVIVVPYVKCPTTFPRHIMVAWDGSREAVRALSDAMPLLKTARTVEICAVGKAKNIAAEYASPDAMVSYLQRHGVTAVARKLAEGDLSVGNTLLNHIVDSGTELLVAGAYGHNRIREIVLGGVTRDLLAHCSIPLFMSR